MGLATAASASEARCGAGLDQGYRRACFAENLRRTVRLRDGSPASRRSIEQEYDLHGVKMRSLT